jgi:hypothetical protein
MPRYWGLWQAASAGNDTAASVPVQAAAWTRGRHALASLYAAMSPIEQPRVTRNPRQFAARACLLANGVADLLADPPKPRHHLHRSPARSTPPPTRGFCASLISPSVERLSVLLVSDGEQVVRLIVTSGAGMRRRPRDRPRRPKEGTRPLSAGGKTLAERRDAYLCAPNASGFRASSTGSTLTLRLTLSIGPLEFHACRRCVLRLMNVRR